VPGFVSVGCCRLGRCRAGVSSNTIPDGDAPGVDVPPSAAYRRGVLASTARRPHHVRRPRRDLSKVPAVDGRQVVARLLATVDSKQTTRDSALGYGLINIAAAVNNSVSVDAPNPVFAARNPFRAQDAAVAAAPAARRFAGYDSDQVAWFVRGGAAPDPLTSGPGLVGWSVRLLGWRAWLS